MDIICPRCKGKCIIDDDEIHGFKEVFDVSKEFVRGFVLSEGKKVFSDSIVGEIVSEDFEVSRAVG